MSAATTDADQFRPPAPPESIPADEAWAFCWNSLVQVSRTFSRPIGLLPPRLRAAATCGYLLCRIADTIEDDPALSTAARDDLFGKFLAVLEHGAEVHPFVTAARSLEADGAQFELATNLDRVLKVFDRLPDPMQQVCTRWVGEMIRGMRMYGHRPAGADGVTTLTTLADLERYCYFVAGTVGHLLTGLFCQAMDALSEQRSNRMCKYAESFGLGLQMVNILKDQTDDLVRGWSFIPQTLWLAQDLSADQMLAGEHYRAAHAAVEPVFEIARQRLDEALEYTLAVPTRHRGIRLFCLLPLWMAARTLVVAHRNDAMFTAGKPVKITRRDVAALIESARTHVVDDAQLRAVYADLWRSDETPATPAV